MEHYFILNLFLAVTMLSVCYSTEVQGYNNYMDYRTGRFYNYLWRRFNHLKRMETGVKRNEMAIDGEVVFGEPTNDAYYPIFYPNNEKPNDGDALKTSSTNKKRLNNVTPERYGIKVLYGRAPGTVMVWPSTL